MRVIEVDPRGRLPETDALEEDEDEGGPLRVGVRGCRFPFWKGRRMLTQAATV
jgi:hypothetical protein